MSLMVKKYPLNYEWKKNSDRTKFEEEQNIVHRIQAEWSFGQKLGRFFSLVMPQFGIVCLLYGSIAWVITG